VAGEERFYLLLKLQLGHATEAIQRATSSGQRRACWTLPI
jgi:hypothetical protein